MIHSIENAPATEKGHIPHGAVRGADLPMNLSPENVVVPEHNKGKRVTSQNRPDVFPVNGAGLRGNHCAGKNDVWKAIRLHT